MNRKKKSYNLSLNSQTSKVAQLKSGAAIVVQLKFGSPKSCFI